MNEQRTTIKEPENDPTGTETNERAQSGRTAMKKVVYWVVSAKHRFIKRLQSTNLNDVKLLCNAYKAMYIDATICTNECLTTFNNGLRFSNGKFLED